MAFVKIMIHAIWDTKTGEPYLVKRYQAVNRKPYQKMCINLRALAWRLALFSPFRACINTLLAQGGKPLYMREET